MNGRSSLGFLACAAVLTCAQLALAAPPKLPTSYSCLREKIECGEPINHGHNCGQQTDQVYFDMHKQRRLDITSFKQHSLPTIYRLVADDKKKVYFWSQPDASDCNVKHEQHEAPPFPDSFEWTLYNTTEYRESVDCPPSPPYLEKTAATGGDKACSVLYGPWLEENTSLVELYFRKGEDLPFLQRMQCAIFPFEIFYTYSNFTLGSPPKHLLKIPKACDH